MPHAIFYMHQTSDVCAGVCRCNRTHQMEKTAKWQKILSATLHISGILHHIIVIYGTLVWNDDICKCFSHFSKIFIFWVIKRIGQKMVQNEKKLCLSRYISQEPYIKWFSFVVCKCKTIISSGVFFIFSKFWFFRFPLCLPYLISQAPYINHDLHLWYTCAIG